MIVFIILIGTKLRLGFIIDKSFQLIKVGFPSIFGLYAFFLIDFSDRKIIEFLLVWKN